MISTSGDAAFTPYRRSKHGDGYSNLLAQGHLTASSMLLLSSAAGKSSVHFDTVHFVQLDLHTGSWATSFCTVDSIDIHADRRAEQAKKTETASTSRGMKHPPCNDVLCNVLVVCVPYPCPASMLWIRIAVADLRHRQASLVQPAFLVPPLDHAVEEELEDVGVLQVLVREHPPRVAQRRHSQGTKQGRQHGG